MREVSKQASLEELIEVGNALEIKEGLLKAALTAVAAEREHSDKTEAENTKLSEQVADLVQHLRVNCLGLAELSVNCLTGTP